MPKKVPHPMRKARWDQLHLILDSHNSNNENNNNENKNKNKNEKTLEDATAYSMDSTTTTTVPWRHVESIFRPIPYTQPQRDLEEAPLKSLHESLSQDIMYMGFISTGDDVKRRIFIYHVLRCVSESFHRDDVQDVENVQDDQEVRIVVCGRGPLKAYGHFDFVLKRGNKRVGVVVAEKGNMEQGLVQNLLGCEVAAECDGLDVVHGIVTNFRQWNFLCSSNHKIEIEEQGLELENNKPTMRALKMVTGKICAMLSDD